MAVEEIAVQKVVNADSMDDETFVMHFEKRHSDQLPGLQHFVNKSEEIINMYREFHDKIHQWHLTSQLDHPHEHGE